ncbi:glutathione peroxidase 2-like [Gigantopelta aegis]|uniref:glutathione peroxidase 2-like n=1 Tax=Gigantopelta aegis TaxID=1735272 RepID=UPI001B888538|nr:glutathione peroxidase 2-like [Gigantopelta aegis]
MLRALLPLLAACTSTLVSGERTKVCCFQSNESNKSVYDYSPYDIHGENKVNLSDYRGQILLIVNVAGFQEPGNNSTEILNHLKYVRPGQGFQPNFPLLKKLEVNGENEHPLYTYLKHFLNALNRDYKNFSVIGVPCNQFGLQEPGKNSTEILNHLKYVRPGQGFQPNFPLLKKLDVNGENEHPLYTYLKSFCPSPREDFYEAGKRIFYYPMKSSDIRWNFEKFLINGQGKPVIRYVTYAPLEEITKDIEQLLDEL